MTQIFETIGTIHIFALHPLIQRYFKFIKVKEQTMGQSNISPKSRLVTLLLCFFLGVFGIHRFYVGKISTGILMCLCFFFGVFGFPILGFLLGLFTGGGVAASLIFSGLEVLLIFGSAIWMLVDLVIILTGSFKDKAGRRIFHWIEPE
jgi:TM2 domain-containing membrane protein YozV